MFFNNEGVFNLDHLSKKDLEAIASKLGIMDKINDQEARARDEGVELVDGEHVAIYENVNTQHGRVIIFDSGYNKIGSVNALCFDDDDIESVALSFVYPEGFDL